MQPPRRGTLVVTATTILVVDLVTKTLAVQLIRAGETATLLGDRVTLVIERNAGAALSIGERHTWVLAVLVVVASVVGAFWLARRPCSVGAALGAGLLLGGAVGNLGDRMFRAPGLLRGHVVDFVAIGWSPVFNVADIGIICGAIILAWCAAIRRPRVPDVVPATDWVWTASAYGCGSMGSGTGISIRPFTASSFSSGGAARDGRTMVGR